MHRFGGWTALHLLRRGARVTLLDAWGPGNVRASSGGETRVMRATYGTHSIFSQMAADALDGIAGSGEEADVDAGPLENGRALEPDGSPFAVTYNAKQLAQLVSP